MAEKIKVLQINHGYNAPFLEVSNQYARVFPRDKYELTVIYLKGERTGETEERTIGDRKIFFESTTKELRGLKLGPLGNLIRVLKKDDYWLVIAHRYKAIYLALLASFFVSGYTVIGVVHAYNVFKKWPRRLLVSCRKKRLKLLGVSGAIRDDIAGHLDLVGFKDVFSQPNCIDIDDLQQQQYDRETARRKLGIPADCFMIATAGRLHYEKDQETLIRAFAKSCGQMKGAKLYIFGSGPLEHNLKEMIIELNMADRIKLTKFVPRLSRLFAAFDLFVLPSRIEPFGLVLLEAMAAGIPVISSKSGGGIEVVGNEDLLFEIGDVDGLGNKILSAFNWTDNERRKIINSAAGRLDNFFSQQAFNKKFWALPFNVHMGL